MASTTSGLAPVLDIQNLTIEFPGQRVVDDVNLGGGSG